MCIPVNLTSMGTRKEIRKSFNASPPVYVACLFFIPDTPPQGGKRWVRKRRIRIYCILLYLTNQPTPPPQVNPPKNLLSFFFTGWNSSWTKSLAAQPNLLAVLEAFGEKESWSSAVYAQSLLGDRAVLA
jgi:hypothetical protein